MELWNLATNRYECKFYMVVLKNIKTFFPETQFLPSNRHSQVCQFLVSEKGISAACTPHSLLGLSPICSTSEPPFKSSPWVM